MRSSSMFKLKPVLVAGLFVFICRIGVQAQTNALSDRYPIIPYPTHLTPGNGDFVINKNTSIVIQNEKFRADAKALEQMIKQGSGISPRESKTISPNSIILKTDNSIES